MNPRPSRSARPARRRVPQFGLPRGINLLAGLLLCACLMAMGCSEEEGIVTYKIPKKVPEQLLPGNERLLAVMIPRGEKVWFFKVMGPEKAVESVAESFREYVSSIRFNEAGNPLLEKLPSGWRRGGEKAMRFATVDINTPGKQLDLSISNLTAPADLGEQAWDSYVVQNVDRWRGQVGLSASKDKWSGAKPFEAESSQGQAVIVDFVGKGGGSMSGGMMSGGRGSGMPPFMAGGGAASPPSGGKAADRASETLRPEMKYDTPQGWRKLEAGGMREAAFGVGPEDGEAQVTVITAGGDLRSNVARWMGQVIGARPEDADVDKMLADAEKFDVSGRKAQRFVISGDASKGQKSIDATIVEMDGGRSKFIKMTGPSEIVSAETNAMRTFLDSLSF